MHKTKYYFLNELNFQGRNAGFKARIDTLFVFDHHPDVEVVNIPLWGGRWSRAKKLGSFLNFLLLKVKQNDVVFIQYPFPKPFIDIIIFIVKYRKIKLCLLIHDVDILRGQKHNKDFKNLSNAHYLISHNKIMSAQLQTIGINTHKVNLEIFDYILNANALRLEDIKERNNFGVNNIIYCGNLDSNKSGFIYSWNKCKANRIVYGVNADSDINENNDYRGSFDSNNPPEINDSGRSYGLVWDGDSTKECSGSFGEYLKFNNPHKTSLYLAMGLPIVAWKDAAISKFIEEKGVGLVVDGLDHLDKELELITDEQYTHMIRNVYKERSKLISGQYLHEAIDHVLSLSTNTINKQ